jgi:hypothetical protein
MRNTEAMDQEVPVAPAYPPAGWPLRASTVLVGAAVLSPTSCSLSASTSAFKLTLYIRELVDHDTSCEPLKHREPCIALDPGNLPTAS